MRTDIRFKLFCSNCGNDLQADSEKSKIEYNSAFTANTTIAIKPCYTCYTKARQPLEMLSRALRMVDDEISSD